MVQPISFVGRTIAGLSALLLLLLTLAASAQSDDSSRRSTKHARSGTKLMIRSDPYQQLFHSLAKRQSDADQQAIVSQASTDPIGAATAADALPNVKGNIDGSDEAATGDIVAGDGDENQYWWNQNVYFNPSANTNGSEDTGWTALPETGGFTLNRTLAIPNKYNNETGIMPFYISQQSDNSLVKRAVIVWPGKPRDAWKYANLMLNARSVAVQNYPQLGINNDSVVIIAPAFLSTVDLTAGGAQSGELVWKQSAWQHGAFSKNPPLKNPISSYDVMDFFAAMMFDKTQYPNLNQVVIAGHSMGGQAAQRYALLKKTKGYDPNMRFWIGNPGSWAWLTDSRPYSNATCSANNEYDTWPYGIGGNQTAVSGYARKDVVANKGAVVSRLLGRQVSYSLALLDEGPGDTHCQAQWQGANHLDRGSNFIMSLGNNSLGLNGAFPSLHTVDFIANVSHQDYPMYSTNISLQRIFSDGLNTRNADLTNTTNPGDKKPKATKRPGGVKAFATHGNENLAIGLLSGSLGLVLLAFTALPFLFGPDQIGNFDKSDAQSYVSFESRQHLMSNH